EKVEIAILVEPADVAGVEPQIAPGLHRIGGTIPITLKDDVRPLRPRDDLAGGADRQRGVAIIDDLDVEVVAGLARASRWTRRHARRDAADRRRLGHAIADRALCRDAEAHAPFLDDRRREGRGVDPPKLAIAAARRIAIGR